MAGLMFNQDCVSPYIKGTTLERNFGFCICNDLVVSFWLSGYQNARIVPSLISKLTINRYRYKRQNGAEGVTLKNGLVRGSLVKK